MPTTKPLGGNVMTQKMGPLPVWGWAVVAIAGIYMYKRAAGNKAAASSATTTDAAGNTYDASGNLISAAGGTGGGTYGLGAATGYASTNPYGIYLPPGGGMPQAIVPTTPTTPTPVPVGSGLGPGQYLLGGGTTPSSGGAGLTSPFAGGYGPPTAGPTQTIRTPTGTYQWIPNPDALRAALSSGQTIYAQPVAGTMVPHPPQPGEQYPYSGIPRYLKVG